MMLSSCLGMVNSEPEAIHISSAMGDYLKALWTIIKDGTVSTKNLAVFLLAHSCAKTTS
jgi:hypothetical protein